MKPFFPILKCLCIALAAFGCQAQELQLQRKEEGNPLPPGPARFSGRVDQSQVQAAETAYAVINYPDPVRTDTFRISKSGTFTAYFYDRSRTRASLAVLVDGNVCYTKEFEQLQWGSNYYEPQVIGCR